MAYSVESTTRTPFNILRESLDKAERLIVQVDGSNIAELLTLLDNIEQQFEILASDDSDLRSEQSRWDGLLSRVNSQPGPLVHAARVAGGFQKLRAAHPVAESFWWHLDREVARRQVNSIRRMITTLVVLVAVAVGGYYAINYFFPPDPEAVLMVETTNGIDRFVTEQRWQEALELVQAARTQLPDNVELMVWETVLYERLGDNAGAAAAWASAQTASASQPIQASIYLGNNRLRVGDVEGALTAAEEALAIDANNPQVYFLLGNIAETQGDVAVAINYFEQTYQLAEGSNPQLAVIARVRMGQLLQSPGTINSSGTTTTTTTP